MSRSYWGVAWSVSPWWFPGCSSWWWCESQPPPWWPGWRPPLCCCLSPASWTWMPWLDSSRPPNWTEFRTPWWPALPRQSHWLWGKHRSEQRYCYQVSSQLSTITMIRSTNRVLRDLTTGNICNQLYKNISIGLCRSLVSINLWWNQNVNVTGFFTVKEVMIFSGPVGCWKINEIKIFDNRNNHRIIALKFFWHFH